MTDLQLLSTFAGVGGFDLAFQRAGVHALTTVEIDRHARGVLAHHWPDATHLTDILETTGDQLRTTGLVPDRTVLTGGFPCQDVSVAGRRAGMDRGTRSGLFWELDRLLGEFRPAWIVFENVPGLLSSNGGRDLGAVIGSLARHGYGFAWRVLDAQFFGVAQRRRRLFIVGRAGDDGSGPAQVLLDGAGGVGDPAPLPQSWEDAPRRAGGGAGARRVVSTILSTGSGGRGHRIDVEGAMGGHLVTYRKSRRAMNVDDYETWVPSTHTNTLNQFDNTGEIRATELIVGPADGVRRLMPIEYERLQGFPDDWTATSNGKSQSDSARYRQIGNAVAVPVVEWIAHRLVRVDASLEGDLICEECGNDTVTVGYALCLDCLEATG